MPTERSSASGDAMPQAVPLRDRGRGKEDLGIRKGVRKGGISQNKPKTKNKDLFFVNPGIFKFNLLIN